MPGIVTFCQHFAIFFKFARSNPQSLDNLTIDHASISRRRTVSTQGHLQHLRLYLVFRLAMYNLFLVSWRARGGMHSVHAHS